MNTVLKSIATFIESLSGCDLTIGTNLFVGSLPLRTPSGSEPPRRCVVILETSPGTVVPDLADWEEKSIQIWNRAESYFQAREDAYCIYESIHGTAGWTLPAVDGGPPYCAMVINAVGLPAIIENPNEKGLYVFSTNFIWSLATEFPP